MQLPITIGLHRSSFLAYGLLAIHLVAAACVLVPSWPLWGRAAAIAALFVSFVTAAGSLRQRLDALRLFADGRLECRLAGDEGFAAAELQPGATVHHWLTVLRAQLGGRKLTVVILPDSLAPEDFRRLRVWLRWRADFSGATDGA